MAEQGTPHFHNSDGHEKILIGVKEFQCIGAKPPFDHPHVFLDMGSETQIVCPYCSTLYSYDPTLSPFEAKPSSCVYIREEAS